MDTDTKAALIRLLEVAYRDTGQSRRVAAFLLAWWNADTCGGFDLTDLWGLDLSLRNDIVRVFTFIAFDQHYPDTLGWRQEFGLVLRRWRPHLPESSSVNSENANDREYENSSMDDDSSPAGFAFDAPIRAPLEDPDVFMAEMLAAADQGDSDAAEFLAMFTRWEHKFGAKLVKG